MKATYCEARHDQGKPIQYPTCASHDAVSRISNNHNQHCDVMIRNNVDNFFDARIRYNVENNSDAIIRKGLLILRHN